MMENEKNLTPEGAIGGTILAPNGAASKVSEVFSKGKYAIDFYQREYKWNKGPVTTLLDDIWRRFYPHYEEIKDDTIDKEKINRIPLYYLNSYVSYETGKETCIVDGQQRLTTLNLICLVLQALYERLPAGERKNAPESELMQKINIKQYVHSTDTYGETSYIMGFGEDRDRAFQALDHRDRSYDPRTVSTKNIIDNYREIGRYLKQKLENIRVLYAFTTYYLNRVFLMHINISNVDDVPMIFEVMNDRGVRLKAHEILKGKLLGKIRDRGEREECVKVWEAQAQMLKDEFPKDKDHLDHFFKRYFRGKYALDVMEDKSLGSDTYHKTIESKRGDNPSIAEILGLVPRDEERIVNFVLHEMPYYVEVYRRVRKKEYDMDSKYPYILFNEYNEMLDNLIELCFASLDTERKGTHDSQEKEKIETIARLFDTFFSLLNLSNKYDSNGFRDMMPYLLKWIRRSENDRFDVFKNVFKTFQEEEDDDGTLNSGDFEYFSYKGREGSVFLSYFFARIEGYLRELTDMGSSYEEYLELAGRHGRSQKGVDVAHIFPSHGRSKQQFFGKNDDEELSEDEANMFKRDRNRAGGLVILERDKHKDVKEKLYAHKKRAYSTSEFIWTKSLDPGFYNSYPIAKTSMKEVLGFKDYEEFDKDSLNERHRLLYNIATQIWNFDSKEG